MAGKAQAWLGVAAVVVTGLLLTYGLLPLAVRLACATTRCSRSESILVVLVEAGACTVLSYSVFRLVSRLGYRLLLVPLAAIVGESLRHALTVWLF